MWQSIVGARTVLRRVAVQSFSGGQRHPVSSVAHLGGSQVPPGDGRHAADILNNAGPRAAVYLQESNDWAAGKRRTLQKPKTTPGDSSRSRVAHALKTRPVVEIDDATRLSVDDCI